MKILGIDPGLTSGWCLYVRHDSGSYIEASGQFRGDDFFAIPGNVFGKCDAAVIERPVAHGPTRPAVVECAWTAGCLWRDMLHIIGRDKIHQLTRLEVRQELTAATHGVVSVRNDATAWAALVLMHGTDSDRKPKRRKGQVVDAGGPLGEVKGHARAALAVAVAFALRQVQA